MPVVLFTPRTVAVYAPGVRLIRIADSRLFFGQGVLLVMACCSVIHPVVIGRDWLAGRIAQFQNGVGQLVNKGKGRPDGTEEAPSSDHCR